MQVPRYPQNLTFVVAIELFYYRTYPIPRYRYLKLPVMLKSSHKEIQRKDDECFEHKLGVVGLVNIILVYGRSKAKHDRSTTPYERF